MRQFLQGQLDIAMVATATGWIFLAYQDSADAQSIVDRDLAAWNESVPRGQRLGPDDIETIRREVRRGGFGRAEGLRDPMLSAVAAPVFGAGGRLVLSLSLVGTRNSFDPDENGVAVRMLKAAAANLSSMLGGT